MFYKYRLCTQKEMRKKELALEDNNGHHQAYSIISSKADGFSSIYIKYMFLMAYID